MGQLAIKRGARGVLESENTSLQMESKADLHRDNEPPERAELRRWVLEIQNADKVFEKYHERIDKIFERYRDERVASAGDDGVKAANNQSRRYNALWSMKQTLKPLLFSAFPNPYISRIHDDNAPVARDAALVLQRLLTTIAQSDQFYDATSETTDDYILAGRGTSWVTYMPEFAVRESDTKTRLSDGQTAPEDEYADADDDGQRPAYEEHTDEEGRYYKEKYEYKIGERTILESVNAKDFLHGVATRWRHVPWVARRIPMLRSELIARFGKKLGNAIPLSSREAANPRHKAGNTDDFRGTFQRAVIYEIWDRVARKVIWICPDYAERVLDTKDDPLQLEGFFPCAKPMYGTMTNDTLLPVPDYTQWQDIAIELDEVTFRISLLTDCLRVAGVYDAEAGEEMKKVTDSTRGNIMIPVRNWSRFQEGGGLSKSVEYLPLDSIVKTLRELYNVRTALVQELYEITGISDIVRGASDPRETASAQKLKGNFANARLKERQTVVARHVREVLRVIAEIVCTLYSDENIKQMSGAESVFIGPDGLFDEARWQASLALLRNEPLRLLAVKIDTDTLADEAITGDKQEATEFLTVLSTYLQNGVAMIQQAPLAGPMLAKIMLFAVRKFKVGRGLEADIERMVDQLAKTGLGTPQGEGGGSEAGMNQMEHDIEKQRLALDQQKLEIEKLKLELEKQKLGILQGKENSTAQSRNRDLERKEFEAVENVRLKEKQIDTQAAGQQAQLSLQSEEMQQNAALEQHAQQHDQAMREQEFVAGRDDAATQHQQSEREFVAGRQDAAHSAQHAEREFAASREDAVHDRTAQAEQSEFDRHERVAERKQANANAAADRKVKATQAKAKSAKPKK
jgi:hypothetical protein